MTLGEGKRKVLMLIDEYSSGGTLTPDRDIEAKMVDFFDLAQKNVAAYKRIVRSFRPGVEDAPSGGFAATSPTSGGGMTEPVVCPAPEGFLQPFRVWRDGALTRRYVWTAGGIVLPAEDVGRVVVEYFALPRTIPQDAPDEYEFEVGEDAAACMPYFVAAQQLLVDLIVDPAPLMELYDRMLSALDTRLPESGGGGVKQSLYR